MKKKLSNKKINNHKKIQAIIKKKMKKSLPLKKRKKNIKNY